MKLWMWITLAVVIAVAAAVVYAYSKPNPNAGDTTKLQRTVSSTEQHTLDTVTITGDQLTAATCADGAACYLAVDGVVYDMSGFPSWMKRGRHHGIEAGTDATEAFVKSGHARDKLQSMPVVGRLRR
ncbi:cytochrome b5 domain-containing protein [Arsenicicoccus bolidensis]|uniref:cytochrome b5 domain-containing protein n=1 Tax=Arsenicicoccus bolidensis TaxID=229480 RepID=UPI0003F658E5|nr:cytochrome b5 domain-containing protein [Arsenicicoccus bolidensis]